MVERQKRLPKALFRRLVTLPLFDFVLLNYVTIVDIRDAKWFVYIRMPLYPFYLYRVFRLRTNTTS